MLTAGWVEPRMRVLEIGTGTGYNAELLVMATSWSASSPAVAAW
jgi:protein-L-isoaspartate O-methyltransferase